VRVRVPFATARANPFVSKTGYGTGRVGRTAAAAGAGERRKLAKDEQPTALMAIATRSFRIRGK